VVPNRFQIFQIFQGPIENLDGALFCPLAFLPVGVGPTHVLLQAFDPVLDFPGDHGDDDRSRLGIGFRAVVFAPPSVRVSRSVFVPDLDILAWVIG
jgi:hypothetical protein